MAQAMEKDQVGKRESLADLIAIAESDATPVTSMLAKRKKPGQVLHDWQVKGYKRRGHKGVRDGVDATNFDHNPRERVHAVAQKSWVLPGVSDFAEEADVAGVKSEMDEQIADAVVDVKHIIERRLCSNEDCVLQNADDPNGANETRGLFKWLDTAAQSLYPVPEKFRPVAAQRYTSTLAAFNEDTIKSLARAAWKRRLGNSVTIQGVLGIDLKAKFSDFTRYDDTAGSKANIRTFNQNASEKAVIAVIDRLVLDTGTINLMASAHLMTDAATGEETAYTHSSGLFLDMEMGGLAYTRMPRIKRLEYKGGGHRAIVDTIFMSMLDNPVGCFSALINS